MIILAGVRQAPQIKDVDAVEHDLTASRFVQPNICEQASLAARLANNGKGLSPTTRRFHRVHGGASTDRAYKSRPRPGHAGAHESSSSNGAGSERPVDPTRHRRKQRLVYGSVGFSKMSTAEPCSTTLRFITTTSSATSANMSWMIAPPPPAGRASGRGSAPGWSSSAVVGYQRSTPSSTTTPSRS